MNAFGFGLLILTFSQLSSSYMVPGAEEKKDSQPLPGPLGAMPKMQLGQMQDDRMMMPPDSMNNMGPMKMMNPPSFQFPMNPGLGNPQPLGNMNIKPNVGVSMLNKAMESFQFTTEGPSEATTTVSNESTESNDEATDSINGEGTTSNSQDTMTTTSEPDEMKTETTNEPVLASATPSDSMQQSTESAKSDGEEPSTDSDKILDLLKETKILDLINIPNGLMDCDNEKNLFCSMVTLGKDMGDKQLPKFKEMMEKIAIFIKDIQRKAAESHNRPNGEGGEGETDMMFDDSDAPKILAHLDTIRKTVDNMESLVKLAENADGEGSKIGEGTGEVSNLKDNTEESSKLSEGSKLAESESESSKLGEGEGENSKLNEN